MTHLCSQIQVVMVEIQMEAGWEFPGGLSWYGSLKLQVFFLHNFFSIIPDFGDDLWQVGIYVPDHLYDPMGLSWRLCFHSNKGKQLILLGYGAKACF